MYGRLLDRIRSEGAYEARALSPKNVKVCHFPRFKCQFGCPLYGKNYGCPPFMPPVDDVRAFLGEYSKAILFGFKDLRTSADFRSLQRFALELEKEAFLMGYYKAFVIVAGSCKHCDECKINVNESCDKRERRPSLESLGIDVYNLVREAGIELDVVTSKDMAFKGFGLLLLE